MKHLCSGLLQDCFLLATAQASGELCSPAGSGILWKNWLQYKVDTKLSGANPVFAMGYLRQLLNLCMSYSSSSKLTACWGLLRDLHFFKAAKSAQEVRETVSKRVFWGRGYPPAFHEDINIFQAFGIWTEVFSALPWIPRRFWSLRAVCLVSSLFENFCCHLARGFCVDLVASEICLPVWLPDVKIA